MIKSFAFIVVFLLSGPLAAHQQKESYSTVLFNHHSGLVEISHRFYLHDAEHALKEINRQRGAKRSKPQDILNDRNVQADFADYVVANFAMRDATGKAVLLETVGFQIEGKYFWVYQQTPMTPDLNSGLNDVQIKMTSLQDIWSRQINYINMDKDGETRSARLQAGDGWQNLQ